MIAQGPTTAQARKALERHRDLAWAELVSRYGATFRYHGTLVTADAEVAQTLLMERRHTQRRSIVYRLMARLVPGAQGPLFQDGERWKRNVQAVMPVFRHANVRRYGETIHHAALRYAGTWRNGGAYPDVFAALCELGAEVVLQIGFGIDPRSELGRRLGAALIRYKVLTMGATHRLDTFGIRGSDLLGLPGSLREMYTLHRQMRVIRALVAEAAYLAPLDSGNPTWMDGLRDLGMPPRELADILNHLYGAYNAVDFTLSCACYELSRAPALAAALRAELLAALGPAAPATPQDLPRLPAMRAFLRECLRRYPVAMGVMRRTGAPISVAGETVPAGSEVMILVAALHHRPEYWEAPACFDPGRWAGGDAPRVPFSYIPFLAGPRQCIGRHLAELNFVAVLGALLRGYTLELPASGARITPYLIPRWDRPLPFVVRRHTPVGRHVEGVLA